MGEKRHSINLVFTLALMGIFALSALFVAVLGAQVYGHTAEQMEDNYNTRTSLIYMTEKIRQSPSGDIRVRSVGDSPALVLTQKIDGRSYETWIFGADGKLKEVTVEEGTGVKPLDGQEIMDIGSLDLKLDGDLLKITVFDGKGGRDESIKIRIVLV